MPQTALNFAIAVCLSVPSSGWRWPDYGSRPARRRRSHRGSSVARTGALLDGTATPGGELLVEMPKPGSLASYSPI